MFQDGFDWKTTSLNRSEVDKAVQQHWLSFDEDKVSKLQFAVAITTAETTGGMTWEEYRFNNVDLGRLQKLHNKRDVTTLGRQFKMYQLMC